MNAKTWLIIGALLGASAVILGAFGAHGLEKASKKWQVKEEVRQRRLDNWETGTRYQMYHALALVGLGLLASQRKTRLVHLTGGAFFLGTLIFSGSLYLIVLTGITKFGAITPIGGLLMIVGWIALAVTALQPTNDPNAA